MSPAARDKHATWTLKLGRFTHPVIVTPGPGMPTIHDSISQVRIKAELRTGSGEQLNCTQEKKGTVYAFLVIISKFSCQTSHPCFPATVMKGEERGPKCA